MSLGNLRLKCCTLFFPSILLFDSQSLGKLSLFCSCFYILSVCVRSFIHLNVSVLVCVHETHVGAVKPPLTMASCTTIFIFIMATDSLEIQIHIMLKICQCRNHTQRLSLLFSGSSRSNHESVTTDRWCTWTMNLVHGMEFQIQTSKT